MTVQRQPSLDLLRGIALAGVLMMNIQAIGMISAAYYNPLALGRPPIGSLVYWTLTHVVVESKFLSIFAMVFGASILVVQERWPAPVFMQRHFRRMLGLFGFGIINAYLIWYGDILLPYAICGAWVVSLRNLSARRQIVIGLSLYMVPVLIAAAIGVAIMLPHGDAGAPLRAAWWPSGVAIAQEIAAYHSSYLAQMVRRVGDAQFMQSGFLLTDYIWRASGMMLVGMGLFKTGVLTGARSTAFYRRMAWLGLGIGLPIAALGAALHLAMRFDVDYSMQFGGQFNYVSAPAIALGYIALAMLWLRTPVAIRLRDALVGVGSMSLSNYLYHGIAGSLLFYGHGLALFGTLPRWAFFFVALGLWLIELGWTHIYLKRFRRGPAEMLLGLVVHGSRRGASSAAGAAVSVRP